MLLTLSVLCFFLGFVVAAVVTSTPKQARSVLDNFLSSLCHVTNTFRSTASSGRDSAISTEKHLIGTDDADLLTKDQCENLPKGDWQRQAYEEVKSILIAQNPGAKKFPCIYATAGYKHNEHRYVFMHSEDPTEPRNVRLLANAMRAYLPLSYSLGSNTSLVIIHPQSDTKQSVESYQQKFWSLLRGLRICDSQSWPSDIPPETNAPKWAFCFDGVPWFPAAMTPAHHQRQSRHAPYFTVAMQPKWVFDNLFRTPERRRAAVDAVRMLMPAYDEIEPSPDLSAYGTEGTTEAHQYYLLDENKTSYCPYEDLDR